MLYARLHNGNWIVGVDAENIRRLTNGEDMLIDIKNKGEPNAPLLMMIYGEDRGALMRKLEEASGQPLPPETRVQ